MILQFGNVVISCSLSWKLIYRIPNIPFHNYIGGALLNRACIEMRIRRREFS
jgi:hypothetical protein